MFLIALFWITLFWTLGGYLISKFVLSGPDLSGYDTPVGENFEQHADDSAADAQFMSSIASLRKATLATKSMKSGLAKAREFADNLSSDLQTDSEFKQVIVNGVKCEWTLATNSTTSRRILFMHGGAFLLGSPKGHRRFTDQLAKLANAAVLSVDYRMLPESSRSKGIKDCQTAYKWILENGPDGPENLDLLIIAGDSAGGNLAMMLSNWSKSLSIRRPDGVIGFSPSLDATMASPTISANLKTDRILGEGLGALLRIPRIIRNWIGLFAARMNPANPLSSPLFGDLTDLPKTLIHASSSEMLLGESIRYTNKARAGGSDVTLQIWQNQLHDWHLFNMHVGSGVSAWNEVKKFIDSLSSNVANSTQTEAALSYAKRSANG
ncbi:MAG: monoterpene epsilon-lactone hydrolase [Cryomorphaceae bacterium]|jgi:monoterpene epsilon-lactone hydrolase